MEQDHISGSYTPNVERKKKNIRGIKIGDPVPEPSSAVVPEAPETPEAPQDHLDPVPLEDGGAPSLSPIMATITMDLDSNDLNLYLEESACMMEALGECEAQCCSSQMNVNDDINASFSDIQLMETDDLGRQVLQSRSNEPILPPPGPSMDMLAEPPQPQLDALELEEVGELMDTDDRNPVDIPEPTRPFSAYELSGMKARAIG